MERATITINKVINKWEKRYETSPVVRCKFCNSRNVTRYGHFKSVQRWWCKDCHRKFSNSSVLPDMKSPSYQILLAMNAYYDKAMPLCSIKVKINKAFNAYTSEAVIYRWIDKYSRLGFRETKGFSPKVGDSWITNKTMVKILGKQYCLLDIIDLDTRFLLATQLFFKPQKQDVEYTLQSAINRAGKAPKNLIVLARYGYWNEFKTARDTGYGDMKLEAFDKEKCSESAKRYFPFSNRSKLISRLRKKDNAQKIVDGWIFHYNFRRVQRALSGKTPAEIARQSSA